MNCTKKFVLYNFAAKPSGHYGVEVVKTDTASAPKSKQASVTHHIIVVDRSGSMYGDIAPLKDTLIKLLTLDEYQRSEMKVSLISYSSVGDCTLHFKKVPVSEVMKMNSPQQKEIRRIQATCMTGMSQSMEMAAEIVDKDELTGISLHSDGYANDPSPYAEVQNMERVCEKLAKLNVFVNSIAYRESSDFKFLSKIANAVSGKCTLATNIKQVYDCLYDTSAILNKQAVPAIVYDLGDADYQVFVSRSAQRVNGAAGEVKVTGLTKDDDGVVYRYKQLTADEYRHSSAVEVQGDDAVYAFAIANLSEGNLNRSKYAMASTYNGLVAKRHARALTNNQLAAMSTELKTVLFDPNTTRQIGTAPINFSGQTSILGLVNVIDQNKEDISLNLKALIQNYKRRGVKRVPGVRRDDGTIEKPPVETEYLDGGEWVKIQNFDVNRNNATLNMLIARPVRLIKVADRKPVSEIMGIMLNDLSTFNNYTIVGDGDINVPKLTVKFATEKAFEAIRALGVMAGASKFDPKSEYVIEVDQLPVVDYTYEPEVKDLAQAFEKVAKAKAVVSILSAISKEDSDKYTKEQVEELKKYCLSKSLNINTPTTTEYDDLKAALSEGSVDIRVSYKVDIGNDQILNLGQFPSANAFLDRMFEMYTKSSGDKEKKATFNEFFNPTIGYRAKTLSAKVIVTKVDEFLKPIYADFLGIKPTGDINRILAEAGVKDSLMDILKGGVAAVIKAKYAVENDMEQAYRKTIIPLTFAIGATGLLPDSLNVKVETADQIQAALPDLKIGKDEREGSFFRIGKCIISIYATNEYYSTGRNADATIPTRTSHASQQSPIIAPAF